MRPHLIVDFGHRTFSALLVSAEGNILPCSQEIRQVLTRYFSSEVLFDSQVPERPEFDWEEAAEGLAGASPRTFFQRARRLGLRRPWELDSAASALRLNSPLAVLSSPSALVDPMARPVLPEVAVTLLDALLEPVFAYLGNHGLASRDIDAHVVMPSFIGRKARLAVHKVFRRRRFQRLNIVPREAAAVMALVEEPPAEYLVWDATGEDLHLYRVATEADAGHRRVRTTGARTVRGLGWPYWVHSVAGALARGGLLPETPGSMLAVLDRALTGVLCDSLDSTDLPTSPRLRLTQGLLEEVLGGEGSGQRLADLRQRAGPALELLGASGLPVILLGAACALQPVEAMVVALVGRPQPLVVADSKALERGARGVASALVWLHQEGARSIEVPPSGSLRVDTLDGEARELLSAERLPSPGEQCYFQCSLQLDGRSEDLGSLLVHLLWGADPTPEGNASLCALPVELAAAAGNAQELQITVQLRRGAAGRRLSAIVEAGVDRLDREVPAPPGVRGFFAEEFATLCSPALDQESP